MAPGKLTSDWLEKMIDTEKKKRSKNSDKSREAERWVDKHKDKIRRLPAAPEPESGQVVSVAVNSEQNEEGGEEGGAPETGPGPGISGGEAAAE